MAYGKKPRTKKSYRPRKKTYKKSYIKPMAVRVFDSVGIQPAKRTGVQEINKLYRLRYVTNVTLSSVAGSVGAYAFRANGLYDPDYTGSGHQPLMRDQLSALYNHYFVKYSKIQVFWNTDATSNVAINTVCGIRLDDDGTAPSWTALLESTRTKWKLGNNCPMYNDNVTLNKPLIMKYSPKSFFGRRRGNDESLGALVGADPSEQAYFILFYSQIPSTASTTSVYATVIIDYSVVYSEPKDVSDS